MPKVKEYLFKIYYFKPSLKFYTEHSISLPCECVNENGTGGPRMWDAVKRLLEMRPLPGITAHIWSGPIMINCEESYPILLRNSDYRGA